ncbi:MAG TPA: TolC family protein [Bryobacteraceae bacterium]|nr:TolC family protein [Bryobacteraceae bacterium]
MKSFLLSRAREQAVRGVALLCASAVLYAQQPSEVPVRPSGFVAVRPYKAPEVPPAHFENSGRLAGLIRAGMLYLTVQDAIALVLENNIDIEVARYNPIIAEWQLERSQAGGALPGVPSSAANAGNVASGQGVAGSQAAAGVSIGGNGPNGTAASNVTIAQIGPIAQTLDPIIQENSVFSHQTAPQADIVQSVLPVLISNTRTSSVTYQQGFLTGGNVAVAYRDSYLNENAPTDVLNPSSAPSLAITFQQNLLRGFGVAVNARTIRVSQLNLKASDLNFKTQVSNIVNQVLNLYYGLSASYEDAKAKSSAVDVAQQFYNNSKIQQEAGTLARLDVVTAESQLATAQYDLVNSETGLRQQELQLKNLISRNGIADPMLAGVQIVPLDRIAVPATDELPPVKDLVATALSNRSDLAAARLGLQSSEVSALGTRNGILPLLVGIAGESAAGLSGQPRTVVSQFGVQTANPYFDGGIGNALGQVVRRNFPTNRAALFFQAPLHNDQAQADYAIDQLQLRQSQIQLGKDLNQVAVDVSNYVVAMRQARGRYNAAVQTRILQQQLLDAEQKKLAGGASTPFNVVQQQRDLVTAQSAEIGALVDFSNARVALDQTLGVTLERNSVSIDEARTGKVARVSSVPESSQSKP